MSDAWASMVTVGRITRPHGNRGQVVVMPDTDFGAERFRPGGVVSARRDETSAVRILEVVESREHRGTWVVGFVGMASIDDAETLRGMELRVPEDLLRPLDEGAYYVHQLLGCEVRGRDGVLIGSVARVDLATGIPMLAVESDHGEVLVPLVDAICRRVDAAGKVIEIDPPDGLLDLNRTKSVTR